MKICLTGYNDFYDGWLHAILLRPLPTNAHAYFVDGYRMAHETGLEFAITALQAEMRLGHIITVLEE